MRTSLSRPALVAVLAFAVAFAAPLGAQDRSSPIIRVYDVRNKRSDEAAELLRRRAADLPEPIEISIDQATGSVVVSGSAAAQTFLGETLRQFDQPPAEAPAGQAGPVRIVGYSIPQANMAAATRLVDALAAGRQDVRFTVDARTSQLLVSAPPEVHRTLERSFPQPAADARNANAFQPAPQPAPAGVQPPQGSGEYGPRQGYQPAPNGSDFVPAGAASPAAYAQPPSGAAQATFGQANSQGGTNGAAGPMNTVAGPPRTGGVTYRLQHLDADQLAQHVRDQWGDAMPIARDESGEKTVIRTQGADGPNGWIILDHTTGTVSIQGTATAVDAWDRIVRGLDVPTSTQATAKLLRVERADPAQVRQAVGFLGYAGSDDVVMTLPNANGGAGMRFASQPGDPNAEPGLQPDAVPPGNMQPGAMQPGAMRNPPMGNPNGQGEIGRFGDNAVGPGGVAGALTDATEDAGAIGPVRIEFVPGLDAIIIRGNDRDVKRVTRLIQEIDRLSATTQPQVEVYQLQNVASEPLSELVTEIYDEILSPRQGQVVIRPLGKPNAILLIGRPESVDVVKGLIQQLDQPVIPSASFRVFRLKHMSSVDAKNRLVGFYEERGGLGVRVTIVPDYRSNSVIVQAGPRDMLEIAQLLDSIDVVEAGAINEVRVFRLTNAVAADLQPILQDAINGQLQGAGQGRPPGTGGQGQAIQQQPQAAGGAGTAVNNDTSRIASQMLTFLQVDPAGKQMLRSGVLFGVRVNADPNSNSLMITGPSEAMDLIAALIQALDQLPDVEAQVKVFTIIHGDATSLAETLDALFGTVSTGGQGGTTTNAFGAGAAALASGATDNSIAPLRFAVDERSNSIVASGSPGSLQIVEQILIRLDETGEEARRTTVYRLANSPATEISEAINELIAARQQLNTADPRLTSVIQQIERELIVVAEPITNALIVSATERFYDDVRDLIEQLDRRPPMVAVHVLIAEVTLGDFEEFGIELGLQDSVLLNNPLGGEPAGFAFNSTSDVNGNGVTSFAVGRTNSTFGYGGLVLSAGNEAISVLLRTLQDQNRLQVLSKPQVMTLDNQTAFVQVGQRVPRVTGVSQNNNGGITNTVTLDDVGILLGVTPRTSPDGLVVMEIDIEKSSVGPISQGIPIFVDAAGNAINSPIFNVTEAQTTVSARSGQTIVLSGLITKSNSITSRKVPYLSDVPFLGRLFRYDAHQDQRTELLIVMTPYIVNREEESNMLRDVESERMNWCLADVVELIGDRGLQSRMGWAGAEPVVIYPDRDPTGQAFLDPAFEEVIRGRLEAACDPNGTFEVPPGVQYVPTPGQIPPEEWSPNGSYGPPGTNYGPSGQPTPAIAPPGTSTRPAGPPASGSGVQPSGPPPEVIRPQPVEPVPSLDLKTEISYGSPPPDRSVPATRSAGRPGTPVMSGGLR